MTIFVVLLRTDFKGSGASAKKRRFYLRCFICILYTLRAKNHVAFVLRIAHTFFMRAAMI